MKMSKDYYSFLKEEMQRHITYYGGMELFLSNADVVNPMSTMWKLFHHVMHDVLFDDDHPAYSNGRKRITRHIPGFKMYRDNGIELHDEHIRTALRKIGREFGLIQ